VAEMARYSLPIFETFARDIGYDIQFHQVGSLKLALNAEWTVELPQQMPMPKHLNVSSRLRRALRRLRLLCDGHISLPGHWPDRGRVAYRC
jgi:hypothetical protein